MFSPNTITLLKSIASAADGYVFSTAIDAKEAVDAALVEQNPKLKDPANASAFGTRLTASGQAMVATLAEADAAEAPAASEPTLTPAASAPKTLSITIDDSVEMPEDGARKERGSKYPFDKLQPKQSFFVPDTTMRTMASTISVANAKYAKPTGEKETVTQNVYQLDAEGKRAKDAEGKFIKLGTKEVLQDVTAQEREFMGAEREENGVKGVRVWRKL